LQTSVTIFYVGISSIAILAANVLTAILAWAIMDLTFYLSQFFQRDDEVSNRPRFSAGLVRSAFSLLLLLSAAIVDWGAGGDAVFLTPTATPFVLYFLALALVLRSFAYIEPTPNPTTKEGRPWSENAYFWLTVVSGSAFLARQLGPEISNDWAIGFILLGLLGSSLIIWRILRRSGWHTWLSLAILSWSFLGAGVTGESIGLAVGGLLLFVFSFTMGANEMYDPVQRIAIGAVFLVSVAAPFTLGGVIGSLISSVLSSALNPLVTISFFLGVTISAVVGYHFLFLLLAPLASWPVSVRALRGAYLLGFGLPVMIVLGLGIRLYPAVSLGSIVFLICSLTIVFLIYFYIRPRIDSTGRLEKFRGLTLDIFGFRVVMENLAMGGLTAVRSIGELLEGENAILWMLFMLLMLVLLILR
jgi:hypothetical protein